MYICIYVYVYMCVSVYLYICISVYVCMYMYVCICMYVQIAQVVEHQTADPWVAGSSLTSGEKCKNC